METSILHRAEEKRKSNVFQLLQEGNALLFFHTYILCWHLCDGLRIISAIKISTAVVARLTG